jgi:hypothetical protein
MTTITLAELTQRSSIDVLDHLDLTLTIPIIEGTQAQGDLIVVPSHRLPAVEPRPWATWRRVPPTGVELLRGGAGGNTHSLVADAGTCEWTVEVRDPLMLAIGMLRATSPVYLIHPEHGGTGIAAGTFIVRRQREALRRPWTPDPAWGPSPMFALVAD